MWKKSIVISFERLPAVRMFGLPMKMVHRKNGNVCMKFKAESKKITGYSPTYMSERKTNCSHPIFEQNSDDENVDVNKADVNETKRTYFAIGLLLETKWRVR